MEQNETTNAYKWKEAFDQKRWHTKFPPVHHPREYIEYEIVHHGPPDEYKFLVHSSMTGSGCRPTLKIQLFPGMGDLGQKMFYDFSKPIEKPIPENPNEPEKLQDNPKSK